MTNATQSLRFHGGPLDGLEVAIPGELPHPSELVWREAHVAPFKDCLYRLRVSLEITAGPIVWEYHAAGQSDLMATAAYWQRQAERKDRRIAALVRQLELLAAPKPRPRRKASP